MVLDEFLSAAISQIIKGVRDAQQQEKTFHKPGMPQELKAGINPVEVRKYDSVQRSSGHQNIEFDLAVTIEKGSKTKGGIGVFAGVVKAGTSGESDKTQTAVNRIKFVVPIVLPFDNVQS
jgi:hypothetical protein